MPHGSAHFELTFFRANDRILDLELGHASRVDPHSEEASQLLSGHLVGQSFEVVYPGVAPLVGRVIALEQAQKLVIANRGPEHMIDVSAFIKDHRSVSR